MGERDYCDRAECMQSCAVHWRVSRKSVKPSPCCKLQPTPRSKQQNILRHSKQICVMTHVQFRSRFAKQTGAQRHLTSVFRGVAVLVFCFGSGPRNQWKYKEIPLAVTQSYLKACSGTAPLSSRVMTSRHDKCSLCDVVGA